MSKLSGSDSVIPFYSGSKPGSENEESENQRPNDIPEDSKTHELSKEELVDLIKKKPEIRWFSRYFTKYGIIRARYRTIIFQEDENGRLLFDIKTIRSNVLQWSAVYNFHKHPDVYRQRGGIRDRAVRISKDKRNPRGQFVPAAPNETRTFNKTARTILVSDALRGKPVAATDGKWGTSGTPLR